MNTAPSTLVRPLHESRPPGLSWTPAEVPARAAHQPTLELGPADPDVRQQPRVSDATTEVTVVRSRWCARPDPGLPDARTWSVSLALALLEASHGLRPIAQLNRWVAEDVLAAIFLQQRRRRRTPTGRTQAPPALRSLRLQHPHPEVAEVSAHVVVAGRSVAMAFRLEGVDGRWLCTALVVGPEG